MPGLRSLFLEHHTLCHAYVQILDNESDKIVMIENKTKSSTAIELDTSIVNKTKSSED